MQIKLFRRIFILCILLLIALFVIKISKPSFPRFASLLASKNIPFIKKEASTPQAVNQLEIKLFEALKTFEVKEEEIKTQFFLEEKRREIRVAIPRGRPLEWIILQLYASTHSTDYQVNDCFMNRKKGTCTITYMSENSKKEKIILIITEAERFMSNSSKIAILIENFNFEANQATIDFLSFPQPLTFSLVPTFKKSGWTAQAADEYNKEIIIHLPLEPQQRNSPIPSSSIVMLHYETEKIQGIIGHAIKKIPNFSGFANLGGSLALEDSRVMTIVLEEIKKNHGYFIDMYCGKNSVVNTVANKIGIPYEEVAFAITGKDDVLNIEDQLKHYAVVAQKRNSLLVSAKASQSFIKALKNVLPVFTQNGIRLVYVSEIVQHPKGD